MITHYTAGVADRLDFPATLPVVVNNTSSDAFTVAGDVQIVGNLPGNCYSDNGAGWISGGLISITYGTTTFEVTAVTARFTDYSTDLLPVPQIPAVYGPFLTQSVEPALVSQSVIGLYISSAGTLIQRAGPLDYSLINDPFLHIGTLVLAGGVLISATNRKFPLADRNDTVATEFVDLMCPLNLGSNTISYSPPAGPSTTLKISCSGGYTWQPTCNVNVSRTNTSTIHLSPTDAPAIMRVWRNSTGAFTAAVTGDVLDTTYYNPSGKSTIPDASSLITAGHFVNIPILYQPSMNTFAMQYPQVEYADEETALLHVGSDFTRFAELKYVIVLGYITVEQGATNLSAAIFSNGEFFNYGVAGAVGGTSSGGGGGGGGGVDLDVRVSNVAYVDRFLGNDITGAVTWLGYPYATFAAAIAGCVAAVPPDGPTAINTFFVQISPGYHTLASMILMPFISVSGAGNNGTNVQLLSHGIEADATFATKADSTLTCANMKLQGSSGITIDLAAIGGSSPNSLLYFTHIEVPYTSYYRGRDVDDVVEFRDVAFAGTLTINSGTVRMLDCACDSTLTVNATVSATDIFLTDCRLNNVSVVGTNVITIRIAGTTVIGTLTLNGSNIACTIDRSSMPPTIVLLNSATYTIYKDILTANQVAGITGAVVPLTAANVAVDASTLATGLSTKAPTAGSSSITTVGTVTAGTWSADVIAANKGGAGTVSGVLKANGSGTVSACSSLADVAYSPLAGSSSITTVGTIGTGTWSGTVIAANKGGAGSSNGVLKADGSGTVSACSSLADVAYSPVAGSSSITTVGTITSGTWHGNAIETSYGGAAGLTGILQATAGTVSVWTPTASALTTGTLPHAQLPTLLSGDIPNNAANTSGTAANLSGTPNLPTGTTVATTPAASDNSTKVATTAYVDRAAGGTATQLTITGTTTPQLTVGYDNTHSLTAAVDSSGNATLSSTGTFSIPKALSVTGITLTSTVTIFVPFNMLAAGATTSYENGGTYILLRTGSNTPEACGVLPYNYVSQSPIVPVIYLTRNGAVASNFVTTCFARFSDENEATVYLNSDTKTVTPPTSVYRPQRVAHSSLAGTGLTGNYISGYVTVSNASSLNILIMSIGVEIAVKTIGR